jgi:hypothetical protein
LIRVDERRDRLPAEAEHVANFDRREPARPHRRRVSQRVGVGVDNWELIEFMCDAVETLGEFQSLLPAHPAEVDGHVRAALDHLERAIALLRAADGLPRMKLAE